MEELFKAISEYSISVAILIGGIWIGLKGKAIPVNVVAYYEKRIQEERAYWQKEVEHVREMYEKKYFELNEKYRNDLLRMSAKMLEDSRKRNEEREEQMRAFLEYLETYQDAQNSVAQLLSAKLSNKGQ